MKADTFQEFERIRRRLRHIESQLADLSSLIASLVDEGSDRAAAKALAVDVQARAKALQDAIPKSN